MMKMKNRMMPRNCFSAVLRLMVMGLFTAMGLLPTVRAEAQLGDIQPFYFALNSKVLAVWPDWSLGKLDGVVFGIDNYSNFDITDGIFSIGGSAGADSFAVGTIAAHSHVFVAPGLSDDGGTGHTFFMVTGSLLDESDDGPNDNAVAFRFTGIENGLPVDSGYFLTGDSVRPSGDGTVSAINFLGGPGNNDAPCSDCYDPHPVADLSIVPEPGVLALYVGLGLTVIGVLIPRFRRNKAIVLPDTHNAV